MIVIRLVLLYQKLRVKETFVILYVSSKLTIGYYGMQEECQHIYVLCL